MSDEFRQILGIRFYAGSLEGLLKRTTAGGLIVVPAAPALAELPANAFYREALEGSDWAITDSGFLVMLWFFLKGERLHRISGLRFLRALLDRGEFRASGATFWIMPSAGEARVNCEWLKNRGLEVSLDDCYVAPVYPSERLEDQEVLTLLEASRPRFIVINLGGGVQERLGFFLRTHLSYQPAIICTGAAISFLSGGQVRIPVWADRLMLGWLLRCINAPRKFFPRYRKAFRLLPLLWKHGAGSVTSRPPT